MIKNGDYVVINKKIDDAITGIPTEAINKMKPSLCKVIASEEGSNDTLNYLVSTLDDNETWWLDESLVTKVDATNNPQYFL